MTESCLGGRCLLPAFSQSFFPVVRRVQRPRRWPTPLLPFLVTPHEIDIKSKKRALLGVRGLGEWKRKRRPSLCSVTLQNLATPNCFVPVRRTRARRKKKSGEHYFSKVKKYHHFFNLQNKRKEKNRRSVSNPHGAHVSTVFLAVVALGRPSPTSMLEGKWEALVYGYRSTEKGKSNTIGATLGVVLITKNPNSHRSLKTSQ
jgi:hypothetical protein